MTLTFGKRTLPAIAIGLLISGCNVAYDAHMVSLSEDTSQTDSAGDSDAPDMLLSDMSDTDLLTDASLDQREDACVPELDTEMCQRLAADCGALNADDNCGNRRTILDCGQCDIPASFCLLNTCREVECRNNLDDDGDGEADCLDDDCLNQRCSTGNARCQASGECL